MNFSATSILEKSSLIRPRIRPRIFIKGTDTNLLLAKNDELKPLKLESKIHSSWYKPTDFSGSHGNTLKFSGLGIEDSDFAYLARIERGNYTKLIIKVKNKEGYYIWGGNSIGFALSNRPLENKEKIMERKNFPYPKGHCVQDGFIQEPVKVGDEFTYYLPPYWSIIYLGAHFFVSNGIQGEYQFFLSK